MKHHLLYSLIALVFAHTALAQKQAVTVNTVIEAENNFNQLVAAKGIKGGFLEVADPEGIVFKPNAVKITDFYNNIAMQAGSLTWHPQFARIALSGDLAVTAGPYMYQNGSNDTDKVFGEYVSVWRLSADNKLRLLIDLGIQHPEPESVEKDDYAEPIDTTKISTAGQDPFNGKKIIMATDNAFNYAMSESTLASYNEFMAPQGRYYFPGFEPIMGPKAVMKFINNEAISVSAETTSAGRSASNDLAYSYGTARIKKGLLVSNYNYVRIWQVDKDHRWNVLLEIFSAIEND
jgi:hypothetical protein